MSPSACPASRRGQGPDDPPLTFSYWRIGRFNRARNPDCPGPRLGLEVLCPLAPASGVLQRDRGPAMLALAAERTRYAGRRGSHGRSRAELRLVPASCSSILAGLPLRRAGHGTVRRCLAIQTAGSTMSNICSQATVVTLGSLVAITSTVNGEHAVACFATPCGGTSLDGTEG
jgi:hypothetical protein